MQKKNSGVNSWAILPTPLSDNYFVIIMVKNMLLSHLVNMLHGGMCVYICVTSDYVTYYMVVHTVVII